MRTLPTQLTTALETRNINFYSLIEIGDGSTVYVSAPLTHYEIEPLKFTAQFVWPELLSVSYTYADLEFIKITRGVTIAGVNYTISTSNFFLTSATWDGIFLTIEASIFRKCFHSLAGDDTYANVIVNITSAFGKTPVFAHPAAAYWNYIFYPTGRMITLNDANQFFTLLRQKYLIFACDNGDDEILYFHIDSINPASLYTILTYHYDAGDIGNKTRQYIWRDEARSIHTSGYPTSPIHNLGYLESTASAPAVLTCIPPFVTKVPIHWKYQTGDSVTWQLNPDNTILIPWLNVVEIFDPGTKDLTLYQELSLIDYFSNTAGGPLPGTIMQVAAYTPLVTTGFDKNLNSSTNNLQALAEAVDELDTGPAIFAATEKTTPNDADIFPLVDSETSTHLTRWFSWANFKAKLITYLATQVVTLFGLTLSGYNVETAGYLALWPSQTIRDHFLIAPLNAYWTAWSTTPAAIIYNYRNHILKATPSAAQQNVTCFLYKSATPPELYPGIIESWVAADSNFCDVGLRMDNGSDDTFVELFIRAGVGTYSLFDAALFYRWQLAGGGITTVQISSVFPGSQALNLSIKRNNNAIGFFFYASKDVPSIYTAGYTFASAWTPTQHGLFVRNATTGPRNGYFHWYATNF